MRVEIGHWARIDDQPRVVFDGVFGRVESYENVAYEAGRLDSGQFAICYQFSAVVVYDDGHIEPVSLDRLRDVAQSAEGGARE